MAAALPFRPQAHVGSYDRQHSQSSRASSRPPSGYSNSISHHKLSSQTSLIPRSPPTTSRKSSRQPSTVQYDAGRAPARRLKSQYPLNSPEPHVEYILVASFDIDRGPVMEHQYPGAISPDENMLAELMLPDQTHMRTQDWTMFFLHKDASIEEEEAAEKEARRQQRHERRQAYGEAILNGELPGEEVSDDSEDEEEEQEGPPLMYVLSLVNTKQDNTVKRGAIVKAMAICTRHSFLYIYKPLLLLALEDYFKSPFPETLASLYHAVNAMDLSLMPRLSLLERHILQASDSRDMFIEKFERMIQQRKADEAAPGKAGSSPDSPTKPGPRYMVPRDTHEFETRVIYNDIPIPIKVPTAITPETVGDFSLVQLIQLFSGPHTTQPQPFALHPHLTTSGALTHPIIVLVNALLTQKRIIFLGHNRPSGEVAEAVLGACALASGGVLRGFTRHAFPYTDLTKIDDLLKVPGYIAGVTNPAFSHHPEWWDLLCDLSTGRMKISSSIESAPVTEGSLYFQQHHPGLLALMQKEQAHSDATGDAAFMEEVNRSIASRHGENTIRDKFRAYISKFTRIAAAFEEVVYGASPLYILTPTESETLDSPRNQRPPSPKGGPAPDSVIALKGHGYVWPSEDLKNRELAASVSRIEGWRNTRSYYTFISDLASRDAAIARSPTSPTSPSARFGFLARPKPRFDLFHAISRLRRLKLVPAEAGAIYLAMASYCTDYESILELLELTPMSEAGLFYIGLGLWHEDARVRDAVVELLDRIRHHDCGRHFYSRLGGFVHMGFLRCWREKEARQDEPSGEDYESLAGSSLIAGRGS